MTLLMELPLRTNCIPPLALCMEFYLSNYVACFMPSLPLHGGLPPRPTLREVARECASSRTRPLHRVKKRLGSRWHGRAVVLAVLPARYPKISGLSLQQ